MRLKYDKNTDTCLAHCDCGITTAIEGTHEYGFWVKCECGYFENISATESEIAEGLKC